MQGDARALTWDKRTVEHPRLSVCIITNRRIRVAIGRKILWRMENKDIYLIQINGKSFTSEKIKECAHVSFPDTDYDPVLVASNSELTKENIIDYLKSNGLASENYRIVCFKKK